MGAKLLPHWLALSLCSITRNCAVRVAMLGPSKRSTRRSPSSDQAISPAVVIRSPSSTMGLSALSLIFG
ncbi:hypothetical protein D3C78_1717900 [compost metagenome]